MFSSSCIYLPVPGTTRGGILPQNVLDEAKGKPFVEALAKAGPPSDVYLDADSGRIYLVYERLRDFGLILWCAGYSGGHAWGEADQRVCYLLSFDESRRLASIKVDTDTTHMKLPERCKDILWPDGNSPERRERLSSAEIGAEGTHRSKILELYGEAKFEIDGSLGYRRSSDSVQFIFDENRILKEIEFR